MKLFTIKKQKTRRQGGKKCSPPVAKSNGIDGHSEYSTKDLTETSEDSESISCSLDDWRSEHPSNEENNDATKLPQEIPLLGDEGEILSPQERAWYATGHGLTQCGKCRIQTHRIGLFQCKVAHYYLTNDNVYKGVCINCNPSLVPPKALRHYKRSQRPRRSRSRRQ